MSTKKDDIIEIFGTALSLVNMGLPVARETWHIIQVAKSLYVRVKAGEDIPIEEIIAAKHLVNDVGNDLLNTD